MGDGVTKTAAPGGTASGADPHAERRSSLRFPFTAAAEILELRAGVRHSARTSDLSAGGCYVDTITPFPADTPIRIRLTHGNQTFEAKGEVRYSAPGMGMGVAFTEFDPEQGQVLRKWIMELGGDAAEPAETSLDAPAAETTLHRADRYVLSELIELLVRKRVLTEQEATTLLRRLTA